MNPIRNSNQPDNYRSLVKKLTRLGSNDWPKFQELPKNIHSDEFHQTKTQTKLKKTYNELRKVQWNYQRKYIYKICCSDINRFSKKYKTSNKIKVTKNHQRRTKNLTSQKPEPIKENLEALIDQSGKKPISTPKWTMKNQKYRHLNQTRWRISTSKIISPQINEQYNSQGSIKSLYRTFWVESLDFETDNVISSRYVESIS